MPTDIDQTLVQNIVKAQDYLHRIITGQTIAEIAAAEATSKRVSVQKTAPQPIEDTPLLQRNVATGKIKGLAGRARSLEPASL